MRRPRPILLPALPLALALFAVVLLTPAPAGAARYRVELITIGPGDALWNAFGHTALRVVDEETGTDRIYNYGVADFGDPGFIWGFVRGKSRYRLAIYPWYESVFSSIAEDRTLYRQILNLTEAQAAELAAFLEWNALPDNAEYYYDHLRDNCSTRVRDALDRVTDGSLRRATASWSQPWTYRDYTLAAGSGRLHFLLGLDLGSGPNQAEVVDGWGMMYLPQYLMRAVGQAVLEEWQALPLAQPALVVYERRAPPAAHGSPHAARWLFVGVLLGLGVLALLLGRGAWHRPATWGRRTAVRLLGAVMLPVALFFGVLGTVFLILGLVSVIPDTHWNENTWVFWPLDFWLVAPAVRGLRRSEWRLGRWLGRYLALRVGLLLAYALLKPTGLFPQDNWAYLFGVALFLVAVLASAVERAPAPIAVAAPSWGPEPGEQTPEPEPVSSVPGEVDTGISESAREAT